MSAKKSRKFTNGPNTELLAVQQLLRETYGTYDLDAIGIAFCANGWEPGLAEILKYQQCCKARNFYLKKRVESSIFYSL